MPKLKILSVVGARPNFIKLAPVNDVLAKHNRRLTQKIIHTGQHYDYNLSRIFFKDLKLPKPDIYLGVGSASHTEQITRIMQRFEKVLDIQKPDLVIVYGDVNSTLACSLVCSRNSSVPLAHVESGLRSFDLSMPEETNRIMTDHLSDYLFVTEPVGVKNLLKEGIPKKNIFLVGDVMIDTLIKYRRQFERSRILKKLNLIPQTYMLATIHRPVNVDNKENLLKIISVFEKIPDDLKIVFPMHPRTRKMFGRFKLFGRLRKIKNLTISGPLNYTDFIKLLSQCKLTITDSGGIQSEATFLRVPCLTLRDSLEKIEVIKTGTVTLCSLNINLVLSKVREVLTGKYKKGKIPKLMDGAASVRIASIIFRSFLP